MLSLVKKRDLSHILLLDLYISVFHCGLLILSHWKVLKWEDVEVGEPKDGEIRVKNKAIGLNFIDIYYRKGVYKPASFPYTPGSALYHQNEIENKNLCA